MKRNVIQLEEIKNTQENAIREKERRIKEDI